MFPELDEKLLQPLRVGTAFLFCVTLLSVILLSVFYHFVFYYSAFLFLLHR